MTAVFFAHNEPIVKMGIEAVRELGIEAKPSGMGSVTDAVTLIRHLRIPTISIGPDDRTAHASDEYVDINQLATLTKALALVIMRWCG
ncbi:MAG: M20/M25/M40 family metallo-hydrolase [Dehalococcoidia bacterium]|nr:M20/M25/M40 family metallo-hydrolase [Dehalococcoidia bacterium]